MVDEPVHKFTVWLWTEDVHREENFLDGDKFIVGFPSTEVRGGMGGTRTESQDRDPRISRNSTEFHV